MAHAEKCPVCGGDGVVRWNASTPGVVTVQCHGCDGRGWVTVADSEYHPLYQYHPTPYHPTPYYPYPELPDGVYYVTC